MAITCAALKITQAIIKAIPKGGNFSQIASSSLKLSDDVAKFLPSLQGKKVQDAFSIISKTKSQSNLLGSIFAEYSKRLPGKSKEEIAQFFANNRGMQNLFEAYSKGGSDEIFKNLLIKTNKMLSSEGMEKTLRAKECSLNSIKKYWREVNLGKVRQDVSNDNFLQNLYKKASRDKSSGAMKLMNLDMELDLLALNPSIGSKINAHGISKGTLKEQLECLDNLLTNGINKNKTFYTDPLAVVPGTNPGFTGGGHVYRDGAFIVTSGINERIEEAGIKTVIVNHCYFSIIDDLQKKFPQVKFIKSTDAVDYFNQLK